MTREEILSHVDHTLLKPEATWPQIQVICDEAVENHTASICINTCYVKQAVEYLAGRIPVCCVVGFPLGAMDTESKAFEAKKAIENGASEVDMVINIGRLKNKEYDAVREDIRAVKQAVGDKEVAAFASGLSLSDFEAAPADLTPLPGNQARVTIHEGKFHQVKRMFAAVEREVLALHRETFGSLVLDEALPCGQWRELTEAEASALYRDAQMEEKHG